MTDMGNNVLADFARRQWASSKARKIWEPRIAEFGRQWNAAELESVASGLRGCALQTIDPEHLPELTRRAAQRDLVVAPLTRTGTANSYAASSSAAPDQGPYAFRVAIGTRSTFAQLVAAWGESDNDAMGQLLGYPECCRTFFARTWGVGSVDPTWYTFGKSEQGPIECNIGLRWLGVRYIAHMPCSFKCAESVAIGARMRELVPQPARGWADALLDMPFQWSARHGIGELITPLVSVTFRTDVSEDLRTFSRPSSSYPEASAHGMRFPYQLAPAFRADDVQRYADNGFKSLDAQTAAHDTVLMAASYGPGLRVLDLGCGNGTLARRLATPGGNYVGVEADARVAARAQQDRDAQDPLGVILPGDMFDPAIVADVQARAPYDRVLFMPGRLLERVDDTNELLAALPMLAAGGQLIVYAYGDWLATHTLAGLCEVAGLRGGGLVELHQGDGVAAGRWRFDP